MRRTFAYLTSVAVWAAPASALAEQVVLPADRDETIYEEGPVSNGAGDHIFAGVTDKGEKRRALLRFDVAAVIPVGATITGASLKLFCSRTKATAESLALWRLNGAWGEGTSDAPLEEGQGAPATPGDATWVYRFFPTKPWSKSGGDFGGASSATATVGAANAFYTWSSTGMVADLQAWVDAPSTNQGWILIGDESSSKDAKRFDSRTTPDSSHHPALTVTYTLPPGPTGACCAADGQCTTVLDPGATCAGNYKGAASSCATAACPQPEGACCVPDASATCVTVSQLACVGNGGTWSGAATSCAMAVCPVVLPPFVDPLPLPAVATPQSGVPGGVAKYRLSMVEISQKLHQQLPPTRVWGFDDGATGGTYPGPTIEAQRGAPIEVVWANQLRDAAGSLRKNHALTVDTCLHGATDGPPRAIVHLHGGHVPQSSDGYPEDTLLPGEETTYHYPNKQDASTIWYHDHAMAITRLNVYMGLAGFYLIRSADEQALGLPSGAFDVPLAIQDRSFNPDGSLKYPTMWMEHFFGDTMLVNGKVWPYLDVKRGNYRFRVLNGCNARALTLSLSNGAPFHQVASDGGLLAAPAQMSSITLTPGERAELVVDFSGYAAGTEIILVNSATAPFPSDPGDGLLPQVMKFRVAAEAGASDPLPSTLRTIAPLSPSAAVATRDFQLDKMGDSCTGAMWMINGKGWDEITEKPKLGTSEIWRFVNTSGATHPMHLHMVFFQVLDRQSFKLVNGTVTPTAPAVPPSPGDAGWKDTVQVAPKEIVRVIARFEDYAGKFPYHCHVLEHEDHEMMRQFETTTTCGDGALGEPLEQCDDGNKVDGDGCDSNCTPSACGNGVVASGETCDPPASCPTSCSDGDACTVDAIVGDPSACTAACVHTPITICKSGDGCCPAGCLAASDGDCPNPGGDAGAAGAAGAAATGGGGRGGAGGAGQAGAGVGPAAASTSDDGGCGCRTEPSRRGEASLTALALLLAGLRRRARGRNQPRGVTTSAARRVRH